MSLPIILAIVAPILAIIYGLILIAWIMKLPAGDGKMKGIALAIQEGAQAYLNRQYKVIGAIGVAVFALLWIGLGLKVALGFAVGAILSGVAGYIGMHVSVRANVRTAEAAKKGLKEALNVAVRGGGVTGLLVVGLALLGVAVFFAISTP